MPVQLFSPPGLAKPVPYHHVAVGSGTRPGPKCQHDSGGVFGSSPSQLGWSRHPRGI